jgi:hypothetical protein
VWQVLIDLPRGSEINVAEEGDLCPTRRLNIVAAEIDVGGRNAGDEEFCVCQSRHPHPDQPRHMAGIGNEMGCPWVRHQSLHSLQHTAH